MALNKDGLIEDSVSLEIISVAGKLAMEKGAKNVTVRNVLEKMGVSNRVFYNRFHNINDVFELVHKEAVLKMRESIKSDIDITKDFFGYVKDIAVKVLINTYDVKSKFSNFMFEFDSNNPSNQKWWTDKMKEIIEIGKKNNHLKDVNSDELSYTIWSFFRGYNADAVNRKLSKEEAVKRFLSGLEYLFFGIAK